MRGPRAGTIGFVNLDLDSAQWRPVTDFAGPARSGDDRRQLELDAEHESNDRVGRFMEGYGVKGD